MTTPVQNARPAIIAAVVLAAACATTEAATPEAATPDPATQDKMIDVEIVVTSLRAPNPSLRDQLRAFLEDVRIRHEGLLKPAIPSDPHISAGNETAEEPKDSVPQTSTMTGG